MLKPAFSLPGLLLLLMFPLAVLAQKTDKIWLKNGDVVTGEIKNLKFAKISFDMTGPGIIQIKWEEVVKLSSDKIFQVTVNSGDVWVTKIDSSFFAREHLTLDDIVEIVRINNKFFKRLDGDVNLGFNYTRSSDILQFNFGSSLTYRQPKLETSLKLNSVISSQFNDSLLSKKQDATLDVLKTLKNHYYFKSDLSWQQNSQLGLANRFLYSGGGGKILVSSNQQRLMTGTGLSFNVEQSTQSSEYVKNLEALVLVQFKKFRYSSPKISIDAYYVLYAGLSDWGRIRMDTDLSGKFEIFKDFNIGISFYDLFDSRPPGGASKNDFGVNFSLGYSFGK